MKYTPQVTSNQLLNLIKHIGWEKKRFFLVGFSIGGLVALHFASRYPEMVKGLLLIAPALFKSHFDLTSFLMKCAACYPVTLLNSKYNCCCLLGSQLDVEDRKKVWSTLVKSVGGLRPYRVRSLLKSVGQKSIRTLFILSVADKVVDFVDVLELIKYGMPEQQLYVTSYGDHDEVGRQHISMLSYLFFANETVGIPIKNFNFNKEDNTVFFTSSRETNKSISHYIEVDYPCSCSN